MKKIKTDGERFKAKRLRLGFKTRPAVSIYIGVSADAVKKWERDERRVPSYAWNMLKLVKKRPAV